MRHTDPISDRLTETTSEGHWQTQVLERLETSRAGLTAAEAMFRLEHYGPNTLPHQQGAPCWLILIRQFRCPLIYLMGIAAVVSLLIHELTDAGFLTVVILLNAAIGGWQEGKAEQSLLALQKLLRIRAVVKRGGQYRELDAEEIVPGDVVVLESGHRVPADLRLIATNGLEADEFL